MFYGKAVSTTNENPIFLSYDGVETGISEVYILKPGSGWLDTTRGKSHTMCFDNLSEPTV